MQVGGEYDLVAVTSLFSAHYASNLTSGDSDNQVRLQEELQGVRNGSTILIIAVQVGINEIQTEYTPADLYPAVSKCVLSDDYEKAAEIFAVAGSFGRFDKKRVTDESAHEAMTMLLIHAFDGMSSEQKSKLQEIINKRFGGAEIDMSICPHLRSLGHPTYYPRYMIQHGLGSFLSDKSEQPLVEGFDPVKAWDQILTDSVGCPKE